MIRTAALFASLVFGLAMAACPGTDRRALDDAALAVMVDTLLPAIAGASGLAVLEPVVFGIESPERVRSYIEARLDEEMPPAEFDGMERAYRLFRLLPEGLDLRAFLLDLYTEQVIGYYDPRLRRLVVVEGVRRDDIAPVVAHELVHALQDQHADLDALVAPERGNDRQLAAQAAAEGQATLVMIALQAAETAGEPIEPGALPDLGPLLRPALEADYADFPVFAAAPRVVREALLFPYLQGATFVQALYRYRPVGADRPVPFGDLLPTSTQQVIHPVDRFIMARAEPLELRFDEPGGGWSIVYDNTLGQFEMTILVTEFLGEGAGELPHPWAGDRYALMDGPDGATALAWYTVWETAAAADSFATRYRQILDLRPDRVGVVTRLEREGRPLVLSMETRAGEDPAAVPVPGIRSLEARPDL
jgi:hypothetical protein